MTSIGSAARGPVVAQNEHAHAVVGCPLLRDERTQSEVWREERVRVLPLPDERGGTTLRE
jgi:hypothetical protein